jgi:hypothetical protein
MADWYVKSGASGGGTGADWANAFPTFAAGVAAAQPNDTIFVSAAHDEVVTVATPYTFNSTIDAPVYVYCVEEDSPPTTLANTAKISLTTPNNISIQNTVVMHGMNFLLGTATGAATAFNLDLDPNSTPRFYEFTDCTFQLRTTGTSGLLAIGNMGTTILQRKIRFNRCGFSWVNAGTIVGISFRKTDCELHECYTIPGTPGLVNGFLSVQNCIVVCTGCDFSTQGVTDPMRPQESGTLIFRDCKFPDGYVGPVAEPGGGACFTYVHNSQQNVDWGMTYDDGLRGTINADATAYRNGGASDGTTPLSWRVDTAPEANACNAFRTQEIMRWNAVNQQPVTVTVDILAAASTAADIWLEVEYMGSLDSPKAEYIESRANPLVTPGALPASGATWTGGAGTPQQLSVTFTPNRKGYFIARIGCSVPGLTFYVDPKLEVA